MRSGRRLGCPADSNIDFGFLSKEVVVLRTEAACVGRLVGSCKDGGGLGGCLRAKVNIMSTQNTRFVHIVSILWVHKFQSVTSVPTECGGPPRNKGSVRTGRRLGCPVNLKVNFESPTKEDFVLRTEAALAAWDARSEAAWAAWKACSEAA